MLSISIRYAPLGQIQWTEFDEGHLKWRGVDIPRPVQHRAMSIAHTLGHT